MTNRTNLNDRFTFRMTREGQRVWVNHLTGLLIDSAEQRKMGQTSDGSFVWPLWQIMSVFGPSIYAGMPHVLIEGNEMLSVD
jgi:hypothetical protein